MNKPSQPDTRKGKYDRDGDRLRGAVDSAADLVSGAETTMTESRGAMTAQQFMETEYTAHLKKSCSDMIHWGQVVDAATARIKELEAELSRLRSQGAGPPSSLKDWNRCPKCHQEISRGALLHVCLTGLASPPEGRP